MKERSRDALKGFFKAGKLPTEDHFHELIDSMLHMQDEGFRKTPARGLEITSAKGYSALVSLKRREEGHDGEPGWKLEHGDEGRRLKLRPSQDKRRSLPPGDEAGGDAAFDGALLTFDARQRVGIRTETPEHALHVDGVVGSSGRAGTWYVPERDGVLQADGQWQILAKGLSGCVALEVVASVSAPGRAHALLHATALNAFNPPLGWFLKWFETAFDGWFDRRFNRRKRIRCQTTWWGERCDRLELRWNAAGPDRPGLYHLEIRTQCRYPGNARIQAHVTQLWPIGSKPHPTPAAGGGSDFGAGS